MSYALSIAASGWGVQHADEQVFTAWVAALPVSKVWRQKQLQRRRAFVARWPRLDDWFAEPLPVRVGRLHDQDPTQAIDAVSFEARPYLCYLALHHGLRLDWPYLTAATTLRVPRCVDVVLVDAVAALVAEATQLGYAQISARNTFWPLLGRLLLAAGHGDLSRLSGPDLQGCRTALAEFGKRDDLALFYGSTRAFTGRATRCVLTCTGWRSCSTTAANSPRHRRSPGFVTGNAPPARPPWRPWWSATSPPASWMPGR